MPASGIYQYGGSRCIMATKRILCLNRTIRAMVLFSLVLLVLSSLPAMSGAAGRLSSHEGLASTFEPDSDAQNRHLLTWFGWGHHQAWNPGFGNNLWYGHHWWYGPTSLKSQATQPDTSKAAAPASPKSPLPPSSNSSSQKPAWTCGRMELNANYKGVAIETATGVSDPGACCAACQMNLRCNVWVLCNKEGGCDDGYGTIYENGRCDLKYQAGYDFLDGAAPFAYSRGPDVSWISGVIYMPPSSPAPPGGNSETASSSSNTPPAGQTPSQSPAPAGAGGPTNPSATGEPGQSSPPAQSPPPDLPREPQPPSTDGGSSPTPATTAAPQPDVCGSQTSLALNTLFGGLVLKRSESATALACCRLCVDEARCNAWSWCYDQSGSSEGCPSSSSSGQSYPIRTCLLKMQPRLNSNPEANPTSLLNAADVPWISGLCLNGIMD